jgi:hypothetical protein
MSTMSSASTDLDEDEDTHKKFVRLQFDTMVEEELQISHENLAKLLKSANLETTVLTTEEEIGKRQDDVSNTFKSERALRVSVTDVSMDESSSPSSLSKDRSGVNVSDMRYFSSSSIKSISNSSPKKNILRSPIASLFRGRHWRPRLVELDVGVCPYLGQEDTKIVSLPDVLSKSMTRSNAAPNMLLQLPAGDSSNRCSDALSFRLLRRSIVYVLFPEFSGDTEIINKSRKPKWLLRGFHRTSKIVTLNWDFPDSYLSVWRCDQPYPALSHVVLGGCALRGGVEKRKGWGNYAVCVKEIPLQFQDTQNCRSSFGLALLQKSIAPVKLSSTC